LAKFKVKRSLYLPPLFPAKAGTAPLSEQATEQFPILSGPMNTTTKKSRSAAGYLALMILGVACTPVNERDGLSVEATGWTVQRSVTKPIENYTFIFPEEGFAYAHRDSLVDACMAAIRRNMAMLEVDTFSVPYKIRFYPSKAAMKEATNIGVSGHADFWIKEVAFVATDDPATIEKENIIPAPIIHETMHMIAMEKWGFPPEDNLWLNEGLATYAADQCNGYTVREIYSYLLTHDMTFPTDSLMDGFYHRDEMTAYHQSACIVQYLLEHFGVEKFGTLWQEGSTSFEQVYGMGFPELVARIDADVAAAYPNGVELDWERFKKGCK